MMGWRWAIPSRVERLLLEPGTIRYEGTRVRYHTRLNQSTAIVGAAANLGQKIRCGEDGMASYGHHRHRHNHHHNHHHHHHHHSHGYHDHHKPAQQSPGSRAWQAVSSGQQTPARPGSRGGGPSRSGPLPRSPSHHCHHHRGCTMRMVSLEVPIASDWITCCQLMKTVTF